MVSKAAVAVGAGKRGLTHTFNTLSGRSDAGDQQGGGWTSQLGNGSEVG